MTKCSWCGATPPDMGNCTVCSTSAPVVPQLNRAAKAIRMIGTDIWELQYVCHTRFRRAWLKRQAAKAERRLSRSLVQESE